MSRLSLFFFITFCQRLSVKLEVNEKITLDLNDKTASFKTNMSPGRYKGDKQTRLSLKTVQPNMQSVLIFFNFCPSLPSLVFIVLLKCFSAVLSGYFYILGDLVAFYIHICLNLAKIRETVPSTRHPPNI